MFVNVWKFNFKYTELSEKPTESEMAKTQFSLVYKML